jgi:hypothetical protein
MSFDHTHYAPCLLWKQGEYQAISRLPFKTKQLFTPLIEIPNIGYDFENETKAKTIDAHLAPFAKRVYEKWGRQPCFVDLNFIGSDEHMATGIHPVRFVFDKLRERMCSAIPVTGLDRNNAYQQEIKNIAAQDKSGICLRIKIEQAAKGTFKNDLDSLLSRIKVEPAICDFIIDLGAPNFVPLKGFSKIIQAIIGKLPYLRDWRTFILLGTSFPETMAVIKKGGEIVPRYEWKLYKMLIDDFKKAELRLPAFGDYVINHPKEIELDWRVVKPAATIRYTTVDGWYIIKGDNVRDYGFDQYHDLSQNILNSLHYCGPTFSWGDEYIQTCTNKTAKTGNLSTWRQVGTNHHILKVTQDLASFYAS